MQANALAKIRAKYPQYADIPDAELAHRIVTKYPQYADLFAPPGAAALAAAAPTYKPVSDPNAAARQMETEITQGLRQGPALPGRITREQLLRNIVTTANEAAAMEADAVGHIDPSIAAVKVGVTPRGKPGLVHKSRAEMVAEDNALTQFLPPVGDPGGGMMPPMAVNKKTGIPIGRDESLIAALLNAASPHLGTASLDPETTKGADPITRAAGALHRFVSSQSSPNAIGTNTALLSGAGALGEISPLLSRSVSLGFAGQMGHGAYEQYKAGHTDDALITGLLTGVAAWHAAGSPMPSPLTEANLGAVARGEAGFSPKIAQKIGKLIDITPEALRDPDTARMVARAMLKQGPDAARLPEGGSSQVPLPRGKAAKIRAREAEAARAEALLDARANPDRALNLFEQEAARASGGNALQEAINVYDQGVDSAIVDRLSKTSRIRGGDYYIPANEEFRVNPMANPEAQQGRVGGVLEGPQGQVERINAGDQRYRVETPALADPRFSVTGNPATADIQLGQWPGETQPRMVGESRPVAPEQVSTGPDFADKSAGHIVGRPDVVYTPAGKRVDVHYAVVPMDEVVPSHTDTLHENPNYPEELQPRDHQRQASRERVASMAAQLNPDVLGAAPYTTDGASIIGPDNLVESGNTRFLAKRRAAQVHPDRWQAYQEWLHQRASFFGIDPEQVAALIAADKRPVLVRVRDSVAGRATLSMAERREFAKESNQSTVAAMAEGETARVDAEKMSQHGLLKLDANGVPTNVNSQAFHQKFVQALPLGERGDAIQADGTLSNAGRRRMRNAVLASAYDDAYALDRALEDTGDNTKNIANAAFDVAPKMAVVRQEIARGNLYPLDIAPNVAEAANILSALRDRGIAADEWLANTSIEGQVAPETEALLRFFEEQKRSKPAIARVLDSYLDGVIALGNPREGSLFGEVEPPSKLELFEAAIEKEGLTNGPQVAKEASGSPQSGDTAGIHASEDGQTAGAVDRATAGEAGEVSEPTLSFGPESAAGSAEPEQLTLEPPAKTPQQRARRFIAEAFQEAATVKKPSERAQILASTSTDAIAEEFGISRSEAASLRNEVQDVTNDLAELSQKMKRSGLSDEEAAQLDAAHKTLMKKLTGLFSGPGVLFDKEVIEAAATILKLESERLGLSLKEAAERLIENRPSMADQWRAALEFLRPSNPSTQHSTLNTQHSPSGPSVFSGGRFRASYAVDKTTGDLMNALAAAPESAALKAVQAVRRVLGGLSDEQQDALGELLVGRRLRGLNDTHEQSISVKRENQIAADPQVLQAAVRYAKEVKPAIEALRKKAGLTESAAAANPDPLFISLMKHATDAEGNPVSLTEGGEQLSASSQPRGSLSSRTRQKDTVHARQATGEADRYVTDVEYLITQSFGEVASKAAMQDLYRHLISEKIAVIPERGKALPHEVEIDGERYPLQSVEISKYGLIGPDGEVISSVHLPKPIAKNLHDIVYKREPSEISAFGKGIQGVITGSQLTANPKELVNHIRRISRLLSAIPPADRSSGVRVAEALVPYIGPKVGTWMRLIGTDMSDPVNIKVLQDIFDANGGSSRPFKHLELTGGPLGIGTAIGKLQRASHELLFGVPIGKGIKGYDLRVRVAGEKIRRAVEGNEDPKRIREFANQFGQYTAHPDRLIEAMKVVNPFAATNLPVRVTELRQMLGGSGLEGGSMGQKALRRGETLWRGLGGTVLALVVLNKLLSGKWPWDNAPGHAYEVNVGRDKDGKSVYLKPQALDPVFARAVNTFGLPGIDAETGVAKGRRDYAASVETGLANQAMNVISSPASNLAVLGSTGYAPYLTKKAGQAPDFLRVVDDRKKKGRAPRSVRNLQAALASLNPAAEVLGGHEQREKLYSARMKALKLLAWPLGDVVRKPSK